MLGTEAAEQLPKLTSKASDTALTLGLALAESIGVRDALDRNLTHQIAATHAFGMPLVARANSFAAGVNK